MSPDSTTSFATRLPTQLHKKLKTYSKKNSLSMNQVLVQSVSELVTSPDRIKELELSMKRIEKKVDQLLKQ